MFVTCLLAWYGNLPQLQEASNPSPRIFQPMYHLTRFHKSQVLNTHACWVWQSHTSVELSLAQAHSITVTPKFSCPLWAWPLRPQKHTVLIFLSSIDFACIEFHMNKIVQHLLLCQCFSLRLVSLQFVNLAACIYGPIFLFLNNNALNIYFHFYCLNMQRQTCHIYLQVLVRSSLLIILIFVEWFLMN